MHALNIALAHLCHQIIFQISWLISFLPIENLHGSYFSFRRCYKKFIKMDELFKAMMVNTNEYKGISSNEYDSLYLSFSQNGSPD